MLKNITREKRFSAVIVAFLLVLSFYFFNYPVQADIIGTEVDCTIVYSNPGTVIVPEGGTDFRIVTNWNTGDPSNPNIVTESEPFTADSSYIGQTGYYNLLHPTLSQGYVCRHISRGIFPYFGLTVLAPTGQSVSNPGDHVVTIDFKAAPTADIKANGSDSAITIPYNTSATISWTSANASSCSVSPTGWSGTSNSGISTGNLTSSVTYELNCEGAVDSVTVNVSQPQIALTTSYIVLPSDGSPTAFGIANIGDSGSAMDWNYEISPPSSWLVPGGNVSGSGLSAGNGVPAVLSANRSQASIGTNHGSIIESCSNNCKGPASVTAFVDLTVPGPSCSLSADKTTVSPGEAVNLSWSGSNLNASSPVSTSNFGAANGTTSKTVNPSVTTTYSITLKGLSNTDTSPANFCTSTVTVSVNPVCSPSTQTKKKNETANFTATGGNDTYSWSAPGSSSPTGSGSGFSTSYSSTGLKTVTLTSDGKTATCTVDVTQQNQATISLNPTVFYFTATQGGANPSSQTLTVSNVGTATLKWTGSDNQSWLSFSPTSNTSPGVSAGGSQGVSVNVNISGLAVGTYSGAITVSDPGASNSPQTATVNLTINSPSSNPILTVTKSGTGTGTVTSSPSGINCGSDCSESYASGTSVTLTAAAAVGSTFGGWSGGGCSGTGTCTLILNGDTTVTATFNSSGDGGFCGDGLCNNGESSFTCPADCGSGGGANPPNASSVKATEADYCVGFGVTASWIYSDPDSDPQSAYQAQVDLQGGSFNPPLLDTGKVLSDSTSAVFSGLAFNTNYQTRVKVWDSTDRASSFVSQTLCQGPGCSQNGQSWKTPKHAYPQVGFTWSPSTPAPSQLVQFTDLTTFFDGKGDSDHDWSWTFGDNGTSTLKNPSHTYLSAGSYNVSETVTDNDNFSCTTSPAKVITVKSPIPTWKEVAPKQ